MSMKLRGEVALGDRLTSPEVGVVPHPVDLPASGRIAEQRTP